MSDLFLKYVRHIFCLLKTRSKSILKPQTNKDTQNFTLKVYGFYYPVSLP